MNTDNVFHQRSGRVEVITGCMFGGKTEELIRLLRRTSIARQKLIVFKHANDSKRYDPVQLASHCGGRLMATPVHTVAHMRQLVTDDIEVVGIDEGQFFEEDLVGFVRWLRLTGRRVIVVILNQTFTGDPFPGPGSALLAIADNITLLTAVCSVCGEPAGFSQRLTGGKDVVQVGEKKDYDARCILHWNPDGAPTE
jgi:thymidine kinase